MNKLFILAIFAALCVFSSSLPTKSELRSQIISKLGSRLAILPPFDDPLRLNDTVVELDKENVKGEIGIKNVVVNGLSTLEENLQLNLITLVFSETIKLPFASASGQYNADVTATNIPEIGTIQIGGHGAFSGHIINLNIRVGGRLKIKPVTGKVSVINLTLAVSFDEFEANGENAAINGEPIDWAIANPLIKPIFDEIFEKHNAEIVAIVQDILNEFLGQFTLAELIEIILRP